MVQSTFGVITNYILFCDKIMGKIVCKTTTYIGDYIKIQKSIKISKNQYSFKKEN